MATLPYKNHPNWNLETIADCVLRATAGEYAWPANWWHVMGALYYQNGGQIKVLRRRIRVDGE
jgi:hypothetical protein